MRQHITTPADEYHARRRRLGMETSARPLPVETSAINNEAPAPPPRDEFLYPPKPLLAQDIMRIACKFYGVSYNEFVGQRRLAQFVKARHAAAWLARKYTRLSLPRLERIFMRDHTTVLHGEQKIERLIDTDDERQIEITALERLCEEYRDGKTG